VPFVVPAPPLVRSRDDDAAGVPAMPRRLAAPAIIAPMRPARSPLAPRRRGGITIVEVLTALVIVTVGLLAMAGTSVLSLRAATTQAWERRVLRRLDLRLSALAAAGCERAVGGTAAAPGDGMREWWTVTAATRGAALVDAAVEWREEGRLRTLTRRSAILC
jgi:Tfp pilus assembly protein PilV